MQVELTDNGLRFFDENDSITIHQSDIDKVIKIIDGDNTSVQVSDKFIVVCGNKVCITYGVVLLVTEDREKLRRQLSKFGAISFNFRIDERVNDKDALTANRAAAFAYIECVRSNKFEHLYGHVEKLERILS